MAPLHASLGDSTRLCLKKKKKKYRKEGSVGAWIGENIPERDRGQNRKITLNWNW